MDDRTLAIFHRLVECLEDASACIQHLPTNRDLSSIHPQLNSLKLVLDNNAEVLRLRIASAGQSARPKLFIVSGGHS